MMYFIHNCFVFNSLKRCVICDKIERSECFFFVLYGLLLNRILHRQLKTIYTNRISTKK